MPDIEIKDVLESVKEVGVLLNEQKTDLELYKETNDLRIKEIEGKGVADPLTEEKLAKIDEAMTKAQDRLDQFEIAMKRPNVKHVDADGNEIDMEAKATEWIRGTNSKRDEYTAAEMTEYKSAFYTFLRHGKDSIEFGETERKALSVGSNPDGGFTVHPDMNGRIVKKVFETSPVRQYASVAVTSSSEYVGFYDLDENDAEWVGETQARAETDTAQVGEWTIPVHEIAASPKASQKLIDDSSWNMEQWIADKTGSRMSRKENTAFTTGDGVRKPRGILTYPDGTTLPGTIERITTGVNGDFPAGPNGGDTLIDAVYGLKAEYRANGVWFLNRGTTAAVRKLKDSDGAMLWQPGIAAGQPATIMGYPAASFEDMPAIATGSLSVAFGDMRSAYQIVDRIGIRTLRDPFTDKPNVIYYTIKRVGGDVVDFDAIKLIEFSA